MPRRQRVAKLRDDRLTWDERNALRIGSNHDAARWSTDEEREQTYWDHRDEVLGDFDGTFDRPPPDAAVRWDDDPVVIRAAIDYYLKRARHDLEVGHRPPAHSVPPVGPPRDYEAVVEHLEALKGEPGDALAARNLWRQGIHMPRRAQA